MTAVNKKNPESNLLCAIPFLSALLMPSFPDLQLNDQGQIPLLVPLWISDFFAQTRGEEDVQEIVSRLGKF